MDAELTLEGSVLRGQRLTREAATSGALGASGDGERFGPATNGAGASVTALEATTSTGSLPRLALSPVDRLVTVDWSEVIRRVPRPLRRVVAEALCACCSELEV